MSTLDPRIEAVRVKYELDKSDFWQIPQNKQWVVKHAALEVVATKAGIIWSLPQVIEANTEAGIAVMAVSGQMGDRIEWATGEASPKNNRNAYPWAMAEKRAKDRVVLKLAGIHGLVYSEDEAEDFKTPVDTDGAEPSGRQVGYRADGTRTSHALKKEQPDLIPTLQREVNECATLISLEKLKGEWRTKAKAEKWNPTFLEALKDVFLQRENEIVREMDRLASLEPEELADLPTQHALEHSLRMHPLNAG